MIYIYLPFIENKLTNFFSLCKNDFFNNNIKFTDNLEKSNIVLYFMNIGKKSFFKDKNMNLKQKFDLDEEIKNIKYYIDLKKKLIIYYREDGTSINNMLNDLIKKYNESILFIIRDYLLKEEKIYNVRCESHYKYIINTLYKKENGKYKYKTSYNNLSKYFCFTFPNCNNMVYTFVGDNWIPYKKFTYQEYNKKNIDVFYVKNYRLNTFNGIYRKALLDKLLEINKNNNFKLFSKTCKIKDYYNNLVKSKIMISVWGSGESLRDDYFCIHHDIIVLKIKSYHLKDFYKIHEKNNIFHFFNVDFSNLEDKINKILNNYEYYYNLHNQKRKILIKKYSLKYHVDKLSKKIHEHY
tara:strand:+ start:1057 stop:2112 length:1056 start_codon:yes stop_codon:yes gene_type:complete